MGCACASSASQSAVEIRIDGEEHAKQVQNSSVQILQCQTRLSKAGSFCKPAHFGAFSIAGTAEQVCPGHRVQGDALPKDCLPWTPDDKLICCGMQVTFSDYLRSVATNTEVCRMKDLMACRDANGARAKLSEYLDGNLGGTYTPGGQQFPFIVFVSTLADILTTSGTYNTHEQTWPIACWNREYGDSIADVLSGKTHAFLQHLLDKPFFVHVGKKNDKIGAFSRFQRDESGRWFDVDEWRPNAQWGVPDHEGLVIKDQYLPLDPHYQQHFWSTTGCEGVNGWRILAEADMFNEPGDKQGHCMMKMLMSANRLYSLITKEVE